MMTFSARGAHPNASNTNNTNTGRFLAGSPPRSRAPRTQSSPAPPPPPMLLRSRGRRQRSCLTVAVGSLLVLAFILGNLSALFFALPSIDGERDTESNAFSWITPKFGSNDPPELSTTLLWKEFLRRGDTTTNNNTSTASSSSRFSRLGIHVLRKGRPARKIIVLGERHSGTTFFTDYLKKCFPDLTVTDTLLNQNHWFQPDPDHLASVVEASARRGGSGVVPKEWRAVVNAGSGGGGGNPRRKGRSPNHYFKDALVIVLFRNPYDWVEAMRRKPWHWPNHLSFFPLSEKNSSMIHNRVDKTGRKANGEGKDKGKGGISVTKSFVGSQVLDWKEFVRRPLYLTDEHDEATQQQQQKHPQDPKHQPAFCQKGYPPNTVSPCIGTLHYVPEQLAGIPPVFLRHLPFDTHQPVYEQQQHQEQQHYQQQTQTQTQKPSFTNGKPFPDLLKLRAAKIQNFLRIPELWELTGIGFLPYDRLLGDRTGENNDKDNDGPEALAKEIAAAATGSEASDPALSCPPLPPFEKKPYQLPREFREWITRSARWDVEGLVGFVPSPADSGA